MFIVKRILAILVIFFITQSWAGATQEINAPAKTVSAFSADGLFGLKDDNGTILVTPEYKKLIRIGNSGWLAQKRNKFGLIDSHGNILVKTKYRHADRIFGTYVKLGNDNDYGLYDEWGNIIIAPEYSAIDPLFNKLFLTKKNYRYGVVDSQGNILLENEYEDIYMPNAKAMRIKFDGEWFEVERLSENEITLPDNARKITINDKDFKITYLVTTTGIASGYSVVTATDYTLKLFSSISPAYEQTIDELMLSQGAETVSIFMKLGWIPKFPFTYAKKYYQNLRNPYNGPLTDVKSDLKKKL